MGVPSSRALEDPASGTTREKGNRSYLNLLQALLAISPPSGTFHRVPEVRSIFFGDETRASLRVLKRQTVHSGDGHTVVRGAAMMETVLAQSRYGAPRMMKEIIVSRRERLTGSRCL